MPGYFDKYAVQLFLEGTFRSVAIGMIGRRRAGYRSFGGGYPGASKTGAVAGDKYSRHAGGAVAVSLRNPSPLLGCIGGSHPGHVGQLAVAGEAKVDREDVAG